MLIRYYNRKIEDQREAYTKHTNQLEDIIRNKENIIRQLKDDAVMDLWNYEVDGGRTVYFKCPRHECGHEWTRTETYGEIEH